MAAAYATIHLPPPSIYLITEWCQWCKLRAIMMLMIEDIFAGRVKGMRRSLITSFAFLFRWLLAFSRTRPGNFPCSSNNIFRARASARASWLATDIFFFFFFMSPSASARCIELISCLYRKLADAATVSLRGIDDHNTPYAAPSQSIFALPGAVLRFSTLKRTWGYGIQILFDIYRRHFTVSLAVTTLMRCLKASKCHSVIENIMRCALPLQAHDTQASW